MKKKTTKTLPLLSILLILLITIVITSTRPQPIELTIPESPILEIPIVQQVKDSIIEPTPVPTETPYPKPTYIPSLRHYDIDKSYDIWFAKNPSSYIEPNNEWVKYYASQLFIDKNGWIKYKNEKVVSLVDTKGNILAYDYYSFRNNYVYDWEQFGSGSQGSLANDDYWVNVDYYLTHGMKGDCDEWITAVTSMMLSGEMSVWQGDKLVKQLIPAKAVMGYVGGIRDGWVEYQVYDKIWLTSTSREKNPETNEYYSATVFIEKYNQFKSVFEFTDKYFRRV